MAAPVTATCIVLAYPDRVLHGQVASPSDASVLAVAVLMPLWASYLIKAYSWRLILSEDGVLDWALAPFGLTGPGFGDVAVWLTFTYLWLPFMILPIFAGLERIPSSLLEASADLGGRGWMTFRRVDPPAVHPGRRGRLDLHLLADARRLHRPGPGLDDPVHRQRHRRLNVAQTCRWPRRYSLVPLAIMLIYLLVARRLGAFEAL